MKTIIILFISLALNTIGYAQVTISLEQAENYINSPDGIPEDVVYAKDINNRLPKFVGVWKGTANGKSIELHLNRFLHLPESTEGFKIDQIAGRLLIKDSATGQILYNTLSISNDEKTYLLGFYFINNSYVMNFANINDNYCMDDGEVYLSISSNDLTTMKLNFLRTQEWRSPSDCPNFSTYVPILPKTVLLTKQ